MDIKKGIVVKVTPDADMPTDSAGNRAHFVSDPMATIGRSTLGRAIEPYLNAAGRDVVKVACDEIGLKWGTVVTKELLRLKDATGVVTRAFKRVQAFYEAVSPDKMGAWHRDLTPDELYQHFSVVITRTLPTMYKKPSDEIEMIDVLQNVQINFRPHRSKITFRGLSGEMITTREEFSIGKAYIILLDKTGVDRAAVASCKLGHFGVPSQITRQDKYSSPSRRQVTRTLGEAEMRILTSYCSPLTVAEMIDRYTNKDAMHNAFYNILRAKQPSNIEWLVDRNKVPFGSSRPMAIVRQLGECAGWGIQYIPYESPWDQSTIEEFKRNEHAEIISQKTIPSPA